MAAQNPLGSEPQCPSTASQRRGPPPRHQVRDGAVAHAHGAGESRRGHGPLANGAKSARGLDSKTFSRLRVPRPFQSQSACYSGAVPPGADVFMQPRLLWKRRRLPAVPKWHIQRREEFLPLHQMPRGQQVIGWIHSCEPVCLSFRQPRRNIRRNKSLQM